MRRPVRRRHLYVLIGSLAVGALAGWGVGSVHDDCEQSCLADGPCPEPPECLRHSFNWTAAVVLGVAVAVTIALVALLTLRRGRRD